METTDYVLVMTTLPAAHDGTAVARALLEEQLAACVNLLPEMRSMYRWKGAIENDVERQLFIKTTRQRLPELWKRLRALHPYEVPEFIVVPIVEGSDAYLRWIAEST